MDRYTSRQAAKILGIAISTLSQYISRGKIPAPETLEVGGFRLHSWTDADLERVRKLLPKIANGRKTRYKKLRKKEEMKTQAGAPALQKRKKKRKK
jgi:predicted site-specific integrase-resolvase